MIKAYGMEVFGDNKRFPFFFKVKDPIEAKIKCESALKTMIGRKPAIKNPKLVMSATEIATVGDINIAINIGTWLANVKDAGSS